MPIVAGLPVGGVTLVCVAVLLLQEIPRPGPGGILSASLIVLLAGPGFGIAFTAVMKRTYSRTIDSLYYGEPKLDVPLPAAAEYKYRLICSWMKTSLSPVGGVLYLGRSGLMFVPLNRNRPANRHPTEIAPLNAISLTLVPPKLGWFLAPLCRALLKTLRPSLEVTWPGGLMVFRVPVPADTLRIIEMRIGELLA